MTSQKTRKQSVSVIIPTRNGASTLPEVLSMLARQSIPFKEILVVDSSSKDKSVNIARKFGAEITVIDQAEFDHGGTRTIMAQKAKGDILLFLTQDAVPVGEKAAENLIEPLFVNENVVVSYGRQLPLKDASPFAEHLRLFNYPAESAIRTLADRDKLGLKTAFISNSFAAYLKKNLEEVGFFSSGLIFGEDTCAVGKLLLQGGAIAYVADAEVYHSHNYTWFQEFRRSFDIGVLHKAEQWLVDTYGRAEGHGLNYMRSELAFLKSHAKMRLFLAYLVRNGLKFLGYTLGKNYKVLPGAIVPFLSMHKGWWKNNICKEKKG